jgi:mRNA-degrading endonuclease RelE of RelBE toxin-antitoxin system
MLGWRIDERPEIVLQLCKASRAIQKTYDIRKHLVRSSGPFLPGAGWRTEKLSGKLKRFYSARLDRKWRIIFEIEGKTKTVVILGISPHLYDRIKR